MSNTKDLRERLERLKNAIEFGNISNGYVLDLSIKLFEQREKLPIELSNALLEFLNDVYMGNHYDD